MFDLNGDGFAAPEEEILSLMMLDDLLRKEERAEAELWSDDEDELYDEDGFWNEAYRRMLERYGAELPWQVLNRFEQERFLLSDECVRMLLFLSRLQAAAHEVEAPVLLRGQYTASFAGYLLGARRSIPCRRIIIAPAAGGWSWWRTCETALICRRRSAPAEPL